MTCQGNERCRCEKCVGLAYGVHVSHDGPYLFDPRETPAGETFDGGQPRCCGGFDESADDGIGDMVVVERPNGWAVRCSGCKHEFPVTSYQRFQLIH